MVSRPVFADSTSSAILDLLQEVIINRTAIKDINVTGDPIEIDIVAQPSVPAPVVNVTNDVDVILGGAIVGTMLNESGHSGNITSAEVDVTGYKTLQIYTSATSGSVTAKIESSVDGVHWFNLSVDGTISVRSSGSWKEIEIKAAKYRLSISGADPSVDYYAQVYATK